MQKLNLTPNFFGWEELLTSVSVLA